MRVFFLLLLSFLSFGCQMKKENFAIDWQIENYLPAIDGQNHIGLAGPVTGVIKDKLIIAGGANFPNGMPWEGGVKRYQHEAHIYTINDKHELVYHSSQDFMDSIAYAANITIEDKIYSIGGERNGQAIADVFIYSIEEDKLVRQEFSLPHLPIALTNGAATYLNNMLYFIGGENEELVSDKIYVLDLKAQELCWKEFLVLPQALTHTIVVNDDQENLFVVGGRKRNNNALSDIYKDVYRIDVNTKNTYALANLPEQLAAGTGIFYEGNIIVFGGDNGTIFHPVEQLLAMISSRTNEVEKQKLIQQKNKIQEAHPGFTKKVQILQVKENSWKQLADIKAESPVTTTAILWKSMVIIPTGEVRAGVRTNQILKGQIN